MAPFKLILAVTKFIHSFSCQPRKELRKQLQRPPLMENVHIQRQDQVVPDFNFQLDVFIVSFVKVVMEIVLVLVHQFSWPQFLNILQLKFLNLLETQHVITRRQEFHHVILCLLFVMMKN